MNNHETGETDPPATYGVVRLANDGRSKYHLRVDTSTDAFAVENGEGHVSIYSGADYSEAKAGIVVPPSSALRIWSCVSANNRSPSGDITSLCCVDSHLRTLDVSSCVAITALHCAENKLQELDLSANVHLVSLYCAGNQLKDLNLRGLSRLTNLDCSRNRLTRLDISHCLGIGSGSSPHVGGNPIEDVRLTAGQLECDLLAGQLGQRGTIRVACNSKFRRWAAAMVRKTCGDGWNFEVDRLAP